MRAYRNCDLRADSLPIQARSIGSGAGNRGACQSNTALEAVKNALGVVEGNLNASAELGTVCWSNDFDPDSDVLYAKITGVLIRESFLPRSERVPFGTP